MGHVPHLVVPRPWDGATIDVTEEQRHHLERVLRRPSGSEIHYTDGEGVRGAGVWTGIGVARGEEETFDRPFPRVVVAVPPPASRDRQRFLVEKLSELGVDRIEWLATSYGSRRLPSPAKARSWALGALEQSRGLHATRVGEALVTIDDLAGPLWAAEQGGRENHPRDTKDLTVLVGPEGGWAPGELGPDVRRIDLGPRLLRVETAAVVMAALCLIPRPSDHSEW